MIEKKDKLLSTPFIQNVQFCTYSNPIIIGKILSIILLYDYCFIKVKVLIINQFINPFPHTTILQQTTLNIFSQKIENLYNWMDILWLKVENIVAKGEIAYFEQFLLLSLCFQKAVCCRIVVWGKVLTGIITNVLFHSFNPLLHTDDIWHLPLNLSFKNIAIKGKIAQNEQFHLLSQYFQLFMNINLSVF